MSDLEGAGGSGERGFKWLQFFPHPGSRIQYPASTTDEHGFNIKWGIEIVDAGWRGVLTYQHYFLFGFRMLL